MSEPTRLSRATLAQRAPGIAAPVYQLERRTPGIVHFGPGAFHRAHQAAYADAVLDSDPRWSISEVALNSTGTADALQPQDGLYVLALLSETPEYRIIGSIAELLTARGQGELILQRLAAPTTQLVTSTVTEKGYCLSPDGGLDMNHPGIAAELAGGAPTTFIGWLVAGLARRKAEAGGPLTVLSCDNLAHNGARLGRAVREYAEATDADLAAWIADNVSFPSSMVDSITPATTDAVRDQVAAATGLQDAWPIQRERFTQWVIEDDFRGARPPFETAGVQFVRDVAPFEEAKLRLLNGPHSTLAYLGLLLGHETVADAMRDPDLSAFVARMMHEDIAPTLRTLEGMELADYADSVLDRFRNPAIRHLLSQIAWDGSQKLPFRILGTVLDRRRAGLPTGRLAVPLAAWFRFLALPRGDGDKLVDPLGDQLAPLAAAGDVDALLAVEAVFPRELAADAEFVAALKQAHAAMSNRNATASMLKTAL
ncbi:mannitol dehydrogenase [Croceibacterium mercuriale]|uniref:Mannitol dehydrogenase n=1 Tax=Croceibacterium mercuriale TaxID=1572751 RepID=A0A0B2BXQ5_9SPHN|nr:mannitol dehydrogenase family protein [Croceibacterium mercuriale]KHL24762.1 mannitol dehydrogenase [Croceibacterium mercuriale]